MKRTCKDLENYTNEVINRFLLYEPDYDLIRIICPDNMRERIGESIPYFAPTVLKDGSELPMSQRVGTRLVLRAYKALQGGDEDRARELYQRALSKNPGLGLIGEFPPSPVKMGQGTVEDTRGAMLDAANRTAEPEPDQNYYWTKEWQIDEDQADKELLKSRTNKFSTVKDALNHLRGLK